MGVLMDGWIDGWIDRWMDGWIDGLGRLQVTVTFLSETDETLDLISGGSGRPKIETEKRCVDLGNERNGHLNVIARWVSQSE